MSEDWMFGVRYVWGGKEVSESISQSQHPKNESKATNHIEIPTGTV